MRTASVAILIAGLSASAFGSDHVDAPSVREDPSTDVADLYAFVRGGGLGLVLAMTVHPFAGADVRFSSTARYVFLIQGGSGEGSIGHLIVCSFPSEPEVFGCELRRGTEEVIAQVQGAVGTTASTEDARFRVFAGLRDDPYFADLAGLELSVATGELQFEGTDSLAGQNVLAIVVGLDPTLVTTDELKLLRIRALTVAPQPGDN